MQNTDKLLNKIVVFEKIANYGNKYNFIKSINDYNNNIISIAQNEKFIDNSVMLMITETINSCEEIIDRYTLNITPISSIQYDINQLKDILNNSITYNNKYDILNKISAIFFDLKIRLGELLRTNINNKDDFNKKIENVKYKIEIYINDIENKLGINKNLIPVKSNSTSDVDKYYSILYKATKLINILESMNPNVAGEKQKIADVWAKITPVYDSITKFIATYPNTLPEGELATMQKRFKDLLSRINMQKNKGQAAYTKVHGY